MKHTKRILTDEEIGFGQELEGVAQPAKPKLLSDSDIGFEAPKPSAFESVKDSAIALGTGVTQGIGMLANVAGADNAASRTMDDATKAMSEYESPFRKAEKQERARKIKEAEASGSTLKEVGAYLGSFAEAPIDTTLNALGTSLPTLAAGFIPGAGQAAAGGFGAAEGRPRGALPLGPAGPTPTIPIKSKVLSPRPTLRRAPARRRPSRG